MRGALSSLRRTFERLAQASDGARTAPAAMGPAAVIELQSVTKTYSLGDVAVHALRGISLSVEKGEYVAIIGASGSGKSTLMHVVGCLDLPTSGRYFLDGMDVAAMSQDELSDVRNRKIGFVFQSYNLIPRTSALQNVELPLIYGGIRSPAERFRRAQRALELVGLADRADHQPNELSGGQQQRVAVARALVTNPSIVLADEPTGALDSVASAELLDTFDRLHASGRTVILITHEVDVAARAHRVIRLFDGRIVTDEAGDAEGSGSSVPVAAASSGP
jgi:putative ABC transport system ATP-binding protein